MNLLFLPLALACFASLSQGALLIIDDFSRGPVSLDTRNGTGRTDLVTASFDNAGSSSSRYTRTLSATYSSALTLDDVAGTLAFEATGSMGTGSSNSAGYYDLFWQNAAPVNLLGQGGTGFVIDVVSVLTVPGFSPMAQIRLNHEPSTPANSRESLSVNLVAGRNLISFDEFSDADLAAFRSIEISNFRQRNGTAITFDSISVVPEPGTITLLLGAFLLTGRRRRALTITP